MPIFESEEMLWQIGFLLMALIYPIWYIALIYLADKDKQVDLMDIAKKESPY